MDENMKIIGIYNIEEYYKNSIEKNIKKVIKDINYTTIIKFLEMLPNIYDNEERLFNWGYSFSNEYYKIINILDKYEGQEIDDLKYKIYILYLEEHYYISSKSSISYEEFITFSRLVNAAFSNYNPNRIRKRDNELYNDSSKEINDFINKISYESLHDSSFHAYELTEYRVKILIDILTERKKFLIENEFNKIDLNDEFLNSILSEKRIKTLKKKKEKRH